MSVRCRFCFLSLISVWVILLLHPPALEAAVGFKPVNPDELKMTSEPLAPGAPAVILEREVYRDDAGTEGRSDRVEEDYFRIKILTEAGRKYGSVEIPSGIAGFIGLTNVQGRTIHPDGSIVEFHGQVFQKTIVKTHGIKYQAKTFTLPDVQVGSVIEYYYTIDFEHFLIWDSSWIVSDELFQKHASFTLRPFEREGYHVNVRWSVHLPPGMPQPEQGKDEIVRLQLANVPAFKTEDFMPPTTELQARVDFIYSYDYFEADASKYWKTVGKRRYHDVESFLSNRGALQNELSRIVLPSDAPEVKLQKIYARVQQLKNTTYMPAKTEEEKKRAHETGSVKVEDVLKRGYGSQDELNWVFLGLARTAGFEAYGLAVSNRGEFFFKPGLMNERHLDQSAVLLKLNGKDLYLQPGVPFAPFGILRWEATGVQALRLDKDGGGWVTTSATTASSSQIERKAAFKLADDGDLQGKVTVTYTGLEGLKRRLEERNEDDVARKKYLEDELKGYIPVASEVKLSNAPDWTGSATPLVAEFSVKIPGWTAKGEHVAICQLGIFGGGEREVFSSPERTYPVYFDFPAEEDDDIAIELPGGWQVTNLPKPQKYDYRVVSYSSAAANDRTSLHFTRQLDINIILLDTKYYGPIRSFFQEVRNGDGQQVVLQPGTTVSSN